ncbi:hypothetical protein BKG68_21355 [Mycobacteroides saopaulense]|uniref:ER-bound oxygenase mpaB/mpaB'/Rubber oxygenase catalytic domain-containing protein n=2 Tax=Mycobacteroides saopaulense TaxID=1578165 RepID=A0ABX3BZ63_9MYCO|nr:hypothetical protein BKG68_21355 [Mycobacteroides saopaulense]OHU09029.1 hypothetical protein BKG73_13315 [Mycobacteroides saopaulense]
MTSALGTDIPRRHPDEPRAVPMITLFSKLLLLGPPTDEQWLQIGSALNTGDRPMDELVDWMYASGMASTRPLFDQALSLGIDSVPDAPEPLRKFFALVEKPPAWVNWDQIRSGQRVFQRGGVDTIHLARDVPFLGGFAASGINRTLLMTKTGQNGASGNAQRFAETMQWALDCIADDGMRPGNPGYRSTLHVRLIHALVRRHVAAAPEWRAEEWGMPVNQTDMAATILGAIYVPAVLSLAFGIVITPRELENVTQLTRYAGWLMGIEEQYLPISFRDGMRRLNHYLMSLYRADETSKAMAVPMAKDPLQWPYRRFASIRRRIAWAQHMSITTLFIGRTQTRKLGLPGYILPWYPALRIPANLVRTGAMSVLPGGRKRQARAGLRRQHAFMHFLAGETNKTSIGHSANYIVEAA